MLNDTYPCYIANTPRRPNHDLEVRDKYNGAVATRVPLVDAALLEEAIAAAARAAEACRRLRPYQRQAVLQHCVTAIEKRADELALALCIEAGKPIKDSRGEVTRLVDTFRLAADEAIRQGGEIMNLEVSPRARGYRGMWRRVPLGPCSFITPFNFPLNLVAHKVAPAIAAGCPFVLKPASNTPVGALIIGEILAQTDLPPGAFSIVPCRGRDAAPLVEDDRLKLLSFTGSDTVGWDIKRRAGKKRVSLELGGNAGCIIDETADLDDAVQRLVVGAFYQSGQSCISVQRIFAHESIYPRLRDQLVAATEKLQLGDPRREDTFIGPVIDAESAQRIAAWIEEAAAAGARVLCGGKCDGVMVQPTLLENVPDTAQLNCAEVFGPVAVLAPYRDFTDALARVNASRFGLQAGVFTRDLYRAQQAWDELDVGGVIIGDVPSWRVDHMPYGGVKDSGQGREGLRWAIEEMTELRLLVIRDAAAHA